MSSSSSNFPPDARAPACVPDPSRLRASTPVNEVQKSRFENVLSRRSQPPSGDEEDPSSDEAAAGQQAAQQAHPLPRPGGLAEAASSTDDPADALSLLGQPRSPDLPPTLADLPAPVQPVAMPQQAHLFAHLAVPLAPGADAGRFEVLDRSGGALVSDIQLNTLPHGMLTVAIGTSVQNASLMDRHLPQLQRRLAEKVSAHLRVQESDADRDGSPQ